MVIMAFFYPHLYWAEFVSDRNCIILIHRLIDMQLFVNVNIRIAFFSGPLTCFMLNCLANSTILNGK